MLAELIVEQKRAPFDIGDFTSYCQFFNQPNREESKMLAELTAKNCNIANLSDIKTFCGVSSFSADESTQAHDLLGFKQLFRVIRIGDCTFHRLTFSDSHPDTYKVFVAGLVAPITIDDAKNIYEALVALILSRGVRISEKERIEAIFRKVNALRSEIIAERAHSYEYDDGYGDE